jgi:Tfp pilus assembly protein PilN
VNMRRVDLDFRKRAPRSPRTGWILLSIGLALAGDVGLSYVRARESVAEHEARLARLPSSRVARPSASARAASPEEIALARETIRRISTPWPNLFGALESTIRGDIALVSIEPDTETGTVLISGESKDYLGVLNYLARLQGTPILRQVDLARHEVKESDPQRPVAFSISASWRDPL